MFIHSDLYLADTNQPVAYSGPGETIDVDRIANCNWWPRQEFVLMFVHRWRGGCKMAQQPGGFGRTPRSPPGSAPACTIHPQSEQRCLSRPTVKWTATHSLTYCWDCICDKLRLPKVISFTHLFRLYLAFIWQLSLFKVNIAWKVFWWSIHKTSQKYPYSRV